MAGEEYPKRPQFFANKFCRLMTKSALANQIGADAVVLLMVIAHTEDAKGYRGPVTYFNGQLGPLIGKNTDHALIRVRDKAVESGWLHYEPGGKSKAGVYWVTIPTEYENTRDKPTDENPADYHVENVMEKAQQAVVSPATSGSTSGEEASVQAERMRHEKRRESVNHSSLAKKPRPSPRENTADAVLKTDDAKPAIQETPKPPRTPQPIDPYFEEICSLIGDAHRVPSGSRIAKVARAMLKTELKPEQIRGLPDVVKKYQHWRTTIDIAAVEATWPWILTPPTTTSTPGQSRYRSHDQQLFDELNSLEGVS